MTKAIEETKRAMYDSLEVVKYRNSKGWGIDTALGKFESLLEAHLEELRKDLNFACAALDVEAARRAKLVQERDDIQGRLHAIDHAYFVQSQANAAAGEELRAAKAKIIEQREAICDLYMAKVQRQELPGTPEPEKNKRAAMECTAATGWISGLWHPCKNPDCSRCKS